MEKIGRYKPGQNVTVRPDGELAGDQLKAGRFVAITGYGKDRCYLGAHAEPGDGHPFGVTQRDSAKPNTEDPTSVDLLVECMTGGIPFVEAGEAIDASPPVDIAVGADGKAVVAGGDVAAKLETGKVADNNAITWTARDAGDDGNDLAVELLNTGKGKTLAVDVDGDTISVTLATNEVGAGEITSTATLVIAAIAEHDTASQLVKAANTGASSGAGVVAAVAKTSLAGGSDTEGTAAVVGKALTSAEEAGEYIEVQFY
jgi:hypothetical protein